MHQHLRVCVCVCVCACLCGGGERVFCSWLRDLFARVLVARVVFIEGARAFKHKKCILERKVFAATNVGQKELGSCPAVVVEGVEVCGGRMRCVGVVKVCGTVLEMAQ